MKKIILLFTLIWILPITSFAMDCTAAGTDCVSADKAAWAISKVYLYTDAFCTGEKQTITILGDTVTTPTLANKVDFAGIPDLGSATIANGTYNCVATKMWDNITYSPATTTASNNCVAATNYTQDICASDSASDLTMVYNPDNSSSYSCNLGETNEWIWVYFSTSSTDNDNSSLADLENDFQPPTSDNLSNGIPLGAALVVSSASSGNLKTTLTDRIRDDGSKCEMLKPAFSFQ